MKKKLPIVLLATSFMFTFVLGVSAQPVISNIKAQLNSALNIELNGKKHSLKDTNGSVLYPISYNGRTYLPLRSLGEALGVVVDYDNSTKTAIIGERKNETNLIKIKPASVESILLDVMTTIDSESLKYESDGAVMNFKNGIMYESTRGGWGFVRYNINKQYTKLLFSAWSKGSSKITISDTDSGIVLKTVNLNDEARENIKVDVSNVSSLKIYANGVKCAVADPVLK